MILTGKVDIAAPADTVFGNVTDFDLWVPHARRKGVTMRRTDGGGDPVPGMTWETDFRFRGKIRHMDSEVVRLLRPEEMAIRSLSRGFEFFVTLQIVTLAAARSRLHVSLEAKPRTLGARLLLQSARLGQSGLEAKFRSRIEGFGRSLERPLGA